MHKPAGGTARLEPGLADLRIARSVMYSDAGFDVSCCGRYLALCELDPEVPTQPGLTPTPPALRPSP